MAVLGISMLLVPLALQTGMNLGQWPVSPWIGRLADRLGNRPVMFVSQLLVAAGLLFFAVATPVQWWWLIGAWVLWIAYAGMNVCLPNLMLKLAPRKSNASYIAAFEAASGLCFAASAILGGVILDPCNDWTGLLLGGLCAFILPVPFRLRLDRAKPGGDFTALDRRAGDTRAKEH